MTGRQHIWHQDGNWVLHWELRGNTESKYLAFTLSLPCELRHKDYDPQVEGVVTKGGLEWHTVGSLEYDVNTMGLLNNGLLAAKYKAIEVL